MMNILSYFRDMRERIGKLNGALGLLFISSALLFFCGIGLSVIFIKPPFTATKHTHQLRTEIQDIQSEPPDSKISESKHALQPPAKIQDICCQPPDTEMCEDHGEGTKEMYYYFRASTNSCALFLYGGCNKYNKFLGGERCVDACGGTHTDFNWWLLDKLGAHSFKEISSELVTWEIHEIKDLIEDWTPLDTPTFNLAGHNWFIQMAHMMNVSCVYLEKVTSETRNSVFVSLTLKHGRTLLEETKKVLPEGHKGLFRVVMCMHRYDLNKSTVEPLTVSCSMRPDN